MTSVAEEAARQLAGQGISCGIVDLRTLSPLDTTTVCEAAARTGAVLTLEEGQTTCGVGAELAYRIRAELPATRVLRVGAVPAPVSSNPVLEAASLPDAEGVVQAVRRWLAA
jgi:pyruvate/2-oxoglutarate/acetoin dehydrogenase E1 component